MQITYNIVNLPQTVTQSGTTKATYGWFADGTKYSVLDASGNGYYYIDSLIYSCTAGTTALESTDFGEGRITLSGTTQTIHYHHKDHLGSIRAITNGSGSTIEQNAYYPFGGRHTFGQTLAQTSSNRYKFNGKELQTTGSLGLLDYGARMYDTKTARWLVQDPLAEKYYPFSPYNYCVNNPVMYIDPNGMDWYSYEEDDEIKYYYSSYQLSEEEITELGNNAKHLGLTYTNGNNYYSLFGLQTDISTLDGKMTQRIDDAVINYADYQKRENHRQLYEYYIQDEAYQKLTDFSNILPFDSSFSANNYLEGSYGDASFLFINSIGNTKAKLSSLPENKNKRSGGYDKLYESTGYQMYIITPNSSKDFKVRITFPTTKEYNDFIKRYNKLFNVK